MSIGSAIPIFPEVISISVRLSCGLLEVVALAVIEEELVFDLDPVFDDDAEGEVVNGPALETSGRELQDGGVLLREVLLDGSIAVAGDGPVVLKTVFIDIRKGLLLFIEMLNSKWFRNTPIQRP